MGDTIETFTILTTAANATLTPIHHRMPVIPGLLTRRFEALDLRVIGLI